MTKDVQKSSYKKFILLVIGFFVLILGVTLALVWWNDFMSLLKGAAGITLSMAGLLTLYSLNKK